MPSGRIRIVFTGPRTTITDAGRSVGAPAWLAEARTGRLSALHLLRARIRELLAGADPATVADAQVVMTELVGNAYRHAMPPWEVRLELTADRARLRMEVDDGCPVMSSMWSCGLALVDRLARDWGVWPTEDGGKTVWAEIDLSH